MTINEISALAGVVQWIECWPENQRVANSQSGHMPGLQARSPQEGVPDRQPHMDVSLPLVLLPFPSLKINK